MRKVTVYNLAIFLLLAGFFCWGNIPRARALDSANASADIVIGQPDMTSNSSNQGNSSPGANTDNWFNGSWTDGKKLIVADIQNNRVLIFNSIPTSNNATADVVIGQPDMASNGINQNGSPAVNTLYRPYTVSSDGVRLFVADAGNNRVLIYNTIPTSNNASADVVVGQADFTHNDDNQGASADVNTLAYPYCVHTDGTKLFVADGHNHRVLIYNIIPASNNARADVVVGQEDFSYSMANRGGSVASNAFDTPSGVFTWGGKMYVNDAYNNRVLIFNSIPTSNNASADIAVGQADLTSVSNEFVPGTAVNNLYIPYHAFTDGTRLYVSDYGNSRVLIYDSIPTASGASANTVIGQQNFTSNSENQGGSVGANTLYWQGALYYGAGKLYVGDVMNNRVLIYSLDAAQSWATKKSKNLGDGIKGKLKRTKIKFNGKKTTAKKGRVYVYENGVLKKTAKIKKSGKWKVSFSEKQRSVNRLFQFRFVSSAGAVVSVSDQFNYYLTGKVSKSTKSSFNPVPMPSGGSSRKNEINQEFWGF